MSWQDDEIAGPMGYKHCILFDCAREAISAFQLHSPAPLALPENICPELVVHLRNKGQEVVFGDNNAVHLYGYQTSHLPASFSLDPLMTGWVRQLRTPSAAVSCGRKKMLSIGYGGALLTIDKALATELEANNGRWNSAYTQDLLSALNGFNELIERRFEIVDLWDRLLGDSLLRIPQEQLMPWRVMRRARHRGERDVIVENLRKAGHPVGTNYPSLQGRNEWGDTILNFFCTTHIGVYDACQIIKRVVDND